MIQNLSDHSNHQSGNIQISFIVPCFNEERNIGRLIESIETKVKNINYELIIVDNGSTDKSIDIIKKSKARLIIDKTKNIGGLRNIGVDSANGEYLVFLDADTSVTSTWNNEIIHVLEEMKNSKIITGSRCSISLTPGFIERYWFEPMVNESVSNYINSAHLVVKKDDFLDIGGFSKSLITAEDYEFCERARGNGYKIINNPKLVVIHEGYPKTIIDFIRREKWHGSQDVSSMKAFIHSKVAIIATLYLSCLLASLFFLIIMQSFSLFSLFIFFSSILCVVAVFEKRRRYKLNIPISFIIYNIYFFSRAMSLVERLILGTSARWNR